MWVLKSRSLKTVYITSFQIELKNLSRLGYKHTLIKNRKSMASYIFFNAQVKVLLTNLHDKCMRHLCSIIFTLCVTTSSYLEWHHVAVWIGFFCWTIWLVDKNNTRTPCTFYFRIVPTSLYRIIYVFFIQTSDCSERENGRSPLVSHLGHRMPVEFYFNFFFR
jgi:hypothetical protein